ncbi:MAG: Nif3-like dinuclear metal center hexameric protein, partial [Rubripirellula sp.]|nr:Nif3-like dinuclear metal center hexameric protein [Rubripirellula sp.]
MQLDTVCGFLSQIAPLKLAESWDNVGLLIGDRKSDIQKIMTCLTVTPDVVTEAIEQKVDLVVAHHPLPFQPLKRITSDNLSGKLILDLIANRIAVYSAHTAYDSSINGINQQWCHLM